MNNGGGQIDRANLWGAKKLFAKDEEILFSDD